MAHSDWVPTKEQDLVDLAQKWIIVLTDTAKQTAFGWDVADCTETAGKITAFLTARSAYEADNSTARRPLTTDRERRYLGACPRYLHISYRLPPAVRLLILFLLCFAS
jgi:hypothetical protein